ncbi:MAG: hypothetical protein IPM83_10660 [Ignavibacteria bacterium]|nr:hypothetical protein [Ignavibacteria bacterium]
MPDPRGERRHNAGRLPRRTDDEGLDERFPVLTNEILDRVGFELNVIKRMGYAGYFLIVWDFIRAAREMGTCWSGTGSAAGSLIADALRITDIDPLKYDLLFERFSNRIVSMPDIDVDFSDDKRRASSSTSRRSTALIPWPRSSPSALSHHAPSSRCRPCDGDRSCHHQQYHRQDPGDPRQGSLTKDALDLPELRWLKTSDDPRLKDMISYALTLEGFARNASLHAAVW